MPKTIIPSEQPPGRLQRLEYYSKRISLPLIALILIILIVNPAWLNLNIDYANLTHQIDVLKVPVRVKKILFFFVHYNVFFLLSGILGASVGASEILSRYRDEPFLAISSPPGRRYLAVNAGISMAAFYLLHYFGDRIFPGLASDPLLMSLVAGFGAMIVMRSKIFNFKTESGENYAVGPDAVLSIFLVSVDRQIDRYRASRRQNLVYEETQSIDKPETAPDFLRAFLVSYQNLSNQERMDIDEEVKKIYANQELLKTPRLQFMTAAFGFLNIMGESNFRELVRQLKKYQQLQDMQPPPQPPLPGPSSQPVGPKAAADTGPQGAQASAVPPGTQPGPTSTGAPSDMGELTPEEKAKAEAKAAAEEIKAAEAAKSGKANAQQEEVSVENSGPGLQPDGAEGERKQG
ncbi:MAG TPA: hypothetical protein VF544_01850 [Pyrinomonadaceae bacterium]|jgi:hypothetical protein